VKLLAEPALRSYCGRHAHMHKRDSNSTSSRCNPVSAAPKAWRARVLPSISCGLLLQEALHEGRERRLSGRFRPAEVAAASTG
jgi:hypothetical protein